MAIAVLVGVLSLSILVMRGAERRARDVALLAASRDRVIEDTLASLDRLARLAARLDTPWSISSDQRELLEGVLSAHVELVDEHVGDPRALPATARMRVRVASIHRLLGEPDRGEAQARTAIREYARLREDGRPDPDEAKAHHELGRVLWDVGRREEAREALGGRAGSSKSKAIPMG